jgi:microcystin-dependent protein
MGQQAGLENITLTIGQMASHTHSFAGTTAAGNTPTPSPSAMLASTRSGFPIWA